MHHLIHFSGGPVQINEESVLNQSEGLSPVLLLLRHEVNQILKDSLADLEDLFGNEKELLASLERLFNPLGIAVADSLEG